MLLSKLPKLKENQMRKLFAIVPLLIVLSLAIGCQKAGQNSGEKAAKPATGKYLAKVNNVPITEEDVKSELKSLPPQVRAAFLSEGGIESFLDELVKKELLYQEAKRQKIQVNPEEIKAEVEKIRKRFSSEKEFMSALEKSDLTLEKVQAGLEKFLAIRKLVAMEVDAKVKVSGPVDDQALEERRRQWLEEVRAKAEIRMFQ